MPAPRAARRPRGSRRRSGASEMGRYSRLSRTKLDLDNALVRFDLPRRASASRCNGHRDSDSAPSRSSTTTRRPSSEMALGAAPASKRRKEAVTAVGDAVHPSTCRPPGRQTWSRRSSAESSRAPSPVPRGFCEAPKPPGGRRKIVHGHRFAARLRRRIEKLEGATASGARRRRVERRQRLVTTKKIFHLRWTIGPPTRRCPHDPRAHFPNQQDVVPRLADRAR